MDTKECRKCEKILPLTEFGRQAKAKDGLKNYCKDCISEMNRKRYERNKDRHLEQVRAWQLENKEKVKGYKRKYQKKQRKKPDKEV